MAEEEEAECCPLCMEELDLTDTSFNACPCGYQVCLWCWHQIKNEYNALCPACRAPYSELSKQRSPLDREDVLRRTKQRKQKEKSERRTASQSKIPTVNRRNLANVRVMQRNLVYVIGLPQHFAEDEILRSHECFGQYGKIVKAVVNKSHLTSDRMNATASAYITFANKDDALSCIIAVDGFYLDGCMLRASFGTTKYCNFFLRSLTCTNPDCLYLHELGEQDDSFTKEEMQSALHSGKAAFRDLTLNEVREGSRFPAPLKALVDSQRANPGAPASVVASSAMANAAAFAERHAHGATAPAHKPRHPNGAGEMRRLDSYSRIVAWGGSGSGVVAGESGDRDSPTSASVSTSSSPATPPPPPHSPHPQDQLQPSRMEDRKPNLRVDTSRTTTDSVVGPLEALKLAAASTSQEPAWARPFPSPSINLHSESDDELHGGPSQHEPVFSPFGLGFHGGSLRPSASPATKDPWGGGASKSASPMRDEVIDDTLISPFGGPAGFPLQLQSGRPTGGSSRLSGLSFASIDAIFSERNESSEALAGLLGVELAPQPLVHGSSSVTNGAKSARGSRFAFANQGSMDSRGESLLSSRGPPPGVSPPSSPYRGLGYSSSFRSAPPPPLPPQSSSSLFQQSPLDSSGFPPLGSTNSLLPPPPPPLPPASSMRSFARSQSEPYPASSSLNSNGSNGLAFLQQMLPNVNISFGGEYSNASLAELNNSSHHQHHQHQGTASSSASGGWGGLSSLRFESEAPPLTRRSSNGSYYDPAIVAAPGLSNFYGLDDERHASAFGGSTGSFRQPRSVMDK